MATPETERAAAPEPASTDCADSGDASVAVAAGHAVSLADFAPLRAFLLELLADESRPLSRRLLALSVAVDLVDMYVPAAVAAGRDECPDARAALALYLEEMRATGGERLRSIAQRAGARSPAAGKMFVAAIIEGRHAGKSARSLFAGACGLLWFFAKATIGYGFARFESVGASHAIRRIQLSLADLDAPVFAAPFEALLRDHLAGDEWLATEPTLRLAYRRAMALYAIYGWHVAAFSLHDVGGAEAAKRAAAIVASDFAPANALAPVAERWPVFPQTMENWLAHRAYAPTMVALATRPAPPEKKN
jgi:hypothetical protein